MQASSTRSKFLSVNAFGRRRWSLSLLAIALFVGATGCRSGLFSQRGTEESPQNPGKVEAIYNISQVVSFDRNLNYVILQTLGADFPAEGAALPLYRDGAQIGMVRISGVQRHRHISADVLEGEPLRGDFVLLEPVESP